MLGRRSPRLSPWAATLLHIYLTYLHHCEVTPNLSAAVFRWHATLRSASSCKLQSRPRRLSRGWTLFALGFVKMAWPSTKRNQFPSCLALLRSSNLFPGSIPLMSLGETFNSLINLRFWEPHSTLTSPWNPISKLYPVPAFTIFDRSSKFVHPWIMTWPFLSRAHWFHCVLTR